MIEDKFANFAEAPGMPASTIIEIVPDDEADLPQVISGLNVATPGEVRITTRGGTTATVSVAPGHVFPVRVKRVWATGTTATGIRGLV